MEGGCSALVVLLVDGDGGQAATHSPFLIDDNLYSGSKVLLEEMGHGRAPNPSSDNSCVGEPEQGREGETAQRERGWLVRHYPAHSGGSWHMHAAGLWNFKRGIHSPSFQTL